MSFPVCLGAVSEDVRVRVLAAGRAGEDAVSLVRGSFEVGYVAEDGSAHRVALTDAWAVGSKRWRACGGSTRAKPSGTCRVAGGQPPTNGVHVGYESWLERDHVIVMDFDQARAASG